MTWLEFTAYFDPHMWVHVHALRMSVCNSCLRVLTFLEQSRG